MDDRWLSVDEIAAYLGIGRDTVYKWITRRKMPAHKAGRLWKFRKEEIDAWVRHGDAGGTATGPGQQRRRPGRSRPPRGRPAPCG
ncbi:MAG: helix-turn-helix domain-containing protein [Bryobacteraceae bacterium]